MNWVKNRWAIPGQKTFKAALQCARYRTFTDKKGYSITRSARTRKECGNLSPYCPETQPMPLTLLAPIEY